MDIVFVTLSPTINEILKWLSPLPILVERVGRQVVVVVVREPFSLVTSVICVQIRGHGSEVMRIMRIVYHLAQVFIYCCVLMTVDS